MKHLIIVKFKENIWNREDAASREMLADIKKIFNRTKQIEGVHTVNIYENVTPRPNRHDLMIEMEMDPGHCLCMMLPQIIRNGRQSTGSIFRLRPFLITNKRKSA